MTKRRAARIRRANNKSRRALPGWTRSQVLGNYHSRERCVGAHQRYRAYVRRLRNELMTELVSF